MEKQQIEEIMDDMWENDQRLFYVAATIIIKTDTKEELEATEETLVTIGEFYEIADTNEVVYIGSDLPDEYANSNYTHRLKGAGAKVA